jgi:hypothetical protein
LGSEPGRGADLFESAAQFPNRGLTPIPFTFTAQPGNTNTVVATLQVPRGSVDDALVAIVKHGL